MFIKYTISVIFTTILTLIYLFSECLSNQADVLFLLDSSGSMRSAFPENIVPFISSFGSSVIIGPQNVLIGVVSSSTPYFNLSTYTNKENLVHAIDTIRWYTYSCKL